MRILKLLLFLFILQIILLSILPSIASAQNPEESRLVLIFFAISGLVTFFLFTSSVLNKMVKARTAELRMSNEALKKSESSLAEAQRIAHLGNWEWDLVNNKTWWSDEIYRISGLEPQEFDATYEAFIDAVHPDDRDYVKNSIDEALKEKKTYDIEHRMMMQNGLERIVHEMGKVFFDENGNPVRMLGTVHDITEHKRAEAALRKSEEKYSDLVEKGNDGIIIIQDGLLKFANQKMLDISGFSMGEVIERPFIDFVSPEYRESLQDRYRKRLSGEDVPRNYETEVISKDGNKIPVDINASVIDREGRPADMAIIRDITERKKAEEALQKYADELSKANEELKSLDKMKDEFLSNISHELNTPLVSIKGYSDLIFDGTLGTLNDEQKKAFDTVSRNTERLRRLVDSLLYISKAEAGTVKYQFEDVQIAEIIDHVVQDMILQARDKGLEIEKDVPDDLPLIKADKARLADMLNNLVDNSIKFTPSGGKIVLNVAEEENNLYIKVIDTGIGIPEELIPNLFQRFYQIDASARRRYGGTGVGLYVCKNIVEAHKGEIWIESGEGAGTTVHLRLPK